MNRSSIVLVAVLFSVPFLSPTSVAAMPPGAMGKWTKEKGKCKDEENIVRITKDRYEEYEDMCKVKTVEPFETYGNTDYRLHMLCSSEGDKSLRTLWMQGPETNASQLKVASTAMKKNEFQWLFRCKR